jgi:hypothetical protein
MTEDESKQGLQFKAQDSPIGPALASYLSDMSYALISSSLRAFQLIGLLAP